MPIDPTLAKALDDLLVLKQRLEDAYAKEQAAAEERRASANALLAHNDVLMALTGGELHGFGERYVFSAGRLFRISVTGSGEIPFLT